VARHHRPVVPGGFQQVRRLSTAVIVISCAVEFAIVFAITRLRYPLSWNLTTWRDIGEPLAAFAAIVGPALAGWLLGKRLQRPRPPRLRIAVVRRRPAFTVPDSPSTRCWALQSASITAAFTVAAVIHSWQASRAYQVGAPVFAALVIWLTIRRNGLVL